MNLLAAAVLALFALGITMAPWHRPDYRFPGRGLLAEAGLLAATLILARLAGRLDLAAGSGWTVGQGLLVAAAYWYAVVGGIGVVRMVLAQVPVREQRGSDEGIGVPDGELARGRLIGILERALALTLILLGQ